MTPSALFLNLTTFLELIVFQTSEITNSVFHGEGKAECLKEPSVLTQNNSLRETIVAAIDDINEA